MHTSLCCISIYFPPIYFEFHHVSLNQRICCQSPVICNRCSFLIVHYILQLLWFHPLLGQIHCFPITRMFRPLFEAINLRTITAPRHSFSQDPASLEHWRHSSKLITYGKCAKRKCYCEKPIVTMVLGMLFVVRSGH